MKNERRRYYVYRMLTLFGAIALSILLFFVLFYMDNIRSGIGRILGILMPFIYGGVMAYLLKPVCNVLERQLYRLFLHDKKASSIDTSVKTETGEKTKKTAAIDHGEKAEKREKRAAAAASSLSILLAILLGIFIVVALLAMVIPQVLNSLYGIVVMIPDSIERFSHWIVKYLDEQPVLVNYIENLSEGLSDKLGDWIRQGLMPNLQMLVDGLTSGVLNIVGIFKNLFIGIIVAIYLLASRKRFAMQSQIVLHSILREKWASAIINEIKFADTMFCGFINGKLLDSAIIGVICFIFTCIARTPYGLLVSVLVGVTNIIPFFGPYLGAIPSALLILMVSPGQCIIFLIFIIILQQFDGNILGPRILGNVTGLSSFWVLFAILAFGGLFGFIGMIVGVPVFAVIYDIAKKLIRRGLKYRGQEHRIDEYKEKFPDK